MELMKTTPGQTTRLNRGNVLIANAQSVDLTPLKARFDVFSSIHQRYIEAHIKVDEAEVLERDEINKIEALDGALERAINTLSAALLLDGEQRRNTFARFSDRGPGEVCNLAYAEKPKAVQTLVANLRRSTGLSKATLEAANKVEQAALKIKEALPGWELRRTYLAVAREGRDSMGAKWDTAYLALRRLTQSVVEEAHLYRALFPPVKRSTKKPEAEVAAADAKPAAPNAPAATPPATISEAA